MPIRKKKKKKGARREKNDINNVEISQIPILFIYIFWEGRKGFRTKINPQNISRHPGAGCIDG